MICASRIRLREDDMKNKAAVLATLNRIMELELAGVVRYTHYALMVYGYSRIPIVDWLRKNADESLTHARLAGELVTWLGGHPSLAIGPLLESHKHDIGDILAESLEHEAESLKAYHALLKLVKDKDVRLEEYARDMIAEEVAHADEVNKMLRRPGQTEPFAR
jgi:bacterioferritin